MIQNRRFIRVFSVIALVAALSGAAAASPPAEASREALQRSVDERIMPEVARLRGLVYKDGVPVNVLTPEEVGRYVRGVIEENIEPEELRGFSRLLAYLGLIEPDTDLMELMVRVYSQQIAGFYDHDTKSYSIVRGAAVSDATDPITIAHELTHALQDQHFRLKEFDTFGRHNDDATLAMMALVEGDASDIMMRFAAGAHARGEGPPLDYTAAMSMSLGPESIAGLPMILAQNMMFPYTYGTRFVSALAERGGDDAINRAFWNPPISTEQIINPVKYFDRDEPYIIELPDLTASLPPAWSLISSETLGQFNLGIYLATHTGTWGVEEAISGWNGDALAAYAGAGADDVFIIYYSAWDSRADAEIFAAHYARLVEMRFADAVPVVADDDLRTWAVDDRLIYLRRRGMEVMVVENAPVALAGTVVAESWNAQKIPFGIAVPVADRRRVQPGEDIADGGL